MKWPHDTRESQKLHAYKHLQSLEFAMQLCKRKRTAVQAGGLIGLWPLRMAQEFEFVMTFEPEPITYDCLAENVRAFQRIEARNAALGAAVSRCSMERRSLGSHRVVQGDAVPIIPLDALGLKDVDLLQLDVEGYELNALRGAVNTINRCLPIIQVEMRGFTEDYASSDAELTEWLNSAGYREVSQQPGNDVVFKYVG